MHAYEKIEEQLKNNRLWFLISLFLIVVLSFLIYAQTISFGLIGYDDDIYLGSGSHLLEGFTFPNLVWSVSYFVNNNWAPVVTWSYMLDAVLYGDWYGGYHLTNVLLHTLNGIMLYLISIRLSSKYFLSFLLAVLFVIHPQHVESVAWLSERKDLLSAFFMFLSIYKYIEFKDKGAGSYLLLSLSAFVLGMMAKVIIAPLPFLLILIDYIFYSSFEGKGKTTFFIESIKNKLVFIFIAIIIGGINYYAQASTGALAASSYISDEIRYANIPVAYMFYPFKTIWPFNLVPFYPYPKEIPVFASLASLLSIILISVFCIIKRDKYKYLFFGWFSYLLLTTPMSGLFATGGHAYADRYSYIANIGLLIILVALLSKIIDLIKIKITSTIVLLLIAGLAFLSINQAALWKDTLTLFEYTLEKSPGNHVAQLKVARELIRKKDMVAAEKIIGTAVKDNPKEARVYQFAARHLYINKKPDQAKKLLLDALNKETREKGILLRELARYYYSEGDYKQAIKYSTEAINTGHEIAAALLLRGIAYKKESNYGAAVKDIEAAINAHRQYVRAYIEMGNIYSELGKNDLAVLYFQEALNMRPADKRLIKAVNQLNKNY